MESSVAALLFLLDMHNASIDRMLDTKIMEMLVLFLLCFNCYHCVLLAFPLLLSSSLRFCVLCYLYFPCFGALFFVFAISY